MRTTLHALLRRLARDARLPEPIYELGARRVEGQERRADPRALFAGRPYIGCDAAPGPGVDEIQDVHRLTIPEGGAGTMLMFDTLEHVERPWMALDEIARCLAPGGILVMTSVMYFPIHGHPDDYWRFTASGFRALLAPLHPIVVTAHGMRALPHTILGIASKGPPPEPLARDVRACVEAWSASESGSWKELALAVTPPFLLGPAYGAFNALLRARRRRGAVGVREGRDP